MIIGKVLNNNYIILKKLGSGSFSQVWLSYDISKKKYIAIKMQNYYDYESAVNELQIMKKIRNNNELDHLNIANKMFNYKVSNGIHICMVFNLFAGSLYDLIKSGKYENGLPILVVKNIMKQIFAGVAILHNKLHIIHSDLKPENILIEGDNIKITEKIKSYDQFDYDAHYEKCIEQYREKNNIKNYDFLYEKSLRRSLLQKVSNEMVLNNNNNSTNSTNNSDDCIVEQKWIDECSIKISDFGNSFFSNEQISSSKSIQTRYYRAPEILLKQSYDKAIDIWSLGCILYELITGQILFDPPNLKQNRDDIHLQLIYNVKLSYLITKHSNLNDEEVDDITMFLKKMLETDVVKRWSINKCLKSKWL